MGVLEWVGAHFLGPLVTLYRTIHNKPRPELLIHELVSTGGGTAIDFQVVVQNVGTKSSRSTINAHVDGVQVLVGTPVVELLPNAASHTIQIRVPRPELGELVGQFNGETTLYGRELVVELIDGKHKARDAWREHIYTPEENSVRAEIQAREWRIGRGEATDEDNRAEMKARNAPKF